MDPRTCLVASVGAAPEYKELAYTLAGSSFRTCFAPVALARMLALQGATAFILVTREARTRWYDRVAEELRNAGLQPEAVDIPDGRNEDEILEIFSCLQARVPDGARVVLDVTFALRHLPFVYLATLAYLVGLRGVEVQGIYYGAYELRAADTAPIIEVTALFRLLQWYHALASVDDSGDWTQVARALRSDVGRLFQRGIGDRQLSRLQTPAEQLARALAMGLPIEAGLRARELQNVLGGLSQTERSAPAARRALGALKDQLAAWAVATHPLKKQELPLRVEQPYTVEDGDQFVVLKKQELPLTVEELQRQLRVAEWYVRHRDLHKVLLVLRECLVSAVLLARASTDRWLDYGRRKPIEDLLNALAERARVGVASETERAVASLWSEIATKRNQFAHAGMAEHEVSVSDAELQALLERCRALLAGTALARIPQLAGDRLLITPLGLSPGVLYSSVSLVKPDRLLIVTSPEARLRTDEALARAARKDLPRDVIELSDPHRGFSRAGASGAAALDQTFVGAAEVLVNVTGGTTVMQYVVERLGNRARRLGVALRRLAVIDRRTPEEQRADPYVLGELIWLDDEDEEPPSENSEADHT